MKKIASRAMNFKTSIFAQMSKRAIELNAINLSQGFPDFDGPDLLKKKAKEAIDKGLNQYAQFQGMEVLRKEVQSYYQRFYHLTYKMDEEITITSGATEAIFNSIMAIVDVGDEVIVFEPFYDSYIASIEMAQGVAIPVTLHAPNFEFNIRELKNKISSKTKLIILNNPHNPTGRVFSEKELTLIAQVAIENDLYVLSDEVYEFLTFKEKHIPIATLENMQERTITISSAGKTFGLTGWKIGWVCTSCEISSAIQAIHQYVTFSVSTPMQYAVAHGLKNLESYLPQYRDCYQQKRDYFYQAMLDLGFDFEIPKGTYFMMVPIYQKTNLSDLEYCQELLEKKKVAAIPPSAFYLNSSDGAKYLRFCYAKTDKTLQEAVNNLKLL